MKERPERIRNDIHRDETIWDSKSNIRAVSQFFEWLLYWMAQIMFYKFCTYFPCTQLQTCVCVWVHAQPCPTLCNPMDCGLYILLCPWDSADMNTGAGCYFLLQGIFLTQGSNPHLLHWQADSLPPHHLGSPNLTCNKCSRIQSLKINSAVDG